MKAAELIVRCLENEGVEYIFALPGEESMDVVDALLESSIRVVVARHEQGAGFMADVYGRLTGKAGVCLATLGPGATNLITAVADANMDRAPLVALTGQVSLDRLHKESHQHLDVVSLFRPITKWNTSLPVPGIIPEALRKAFKLAQTEKPGATHVEIPEDVAKLATDEGPLLAQFPRLGPASDEQLNRAARIVGEARCPLVLAGNGVIRARAAAALTRFAERANIPVVTTFMGKGVISDRHPLARGAIGLQAHDYTIFGLDGVDTVITVGYDLVEYSPRWWNPQRAKNIVHIDMSPAEVDAAYVVSVGVVGDLAPSLEALADRVTPRTTVVPPSFREWLSAEADRLEHDTSCPLKPQRIFAALRAALADEDIVVSDVGAHKLWLARTFPCYAPNTCLISNGFASMGIAVPGAVAAKLACPDRRVVAVTGDGGFMMNSQELETAVRLELPLVVLVLNDSGYGLIRLKQLSHFQRTAFTDFSNPDFVRYAQSFGALGYRVQSAGELGPLLKAALAQKRVVVVECPVDAAENLRLARGQA